ncbi:MAG: alpha/beta fold hydrolase [Anaerolineales bacterium]
MGTGAPVILTHGLAASLRDWDDLLPDLAAFGYAAHALDLLGHGESAKPADPREYTFESVFAHFSAWIDSLSIDAPMILIGHSLGGGLCMQYALLHPQRARALVLINPFYDLRQLPPLIRFAFQRQLIRPAWIERLPYRAFRLLVELTSFHLSMGGKQTHSLPEAIRRQTALDYKRAAAGIYHIPRALPHFELNRVRQPTLLLWGERDQTLAPQSFPQLASSLPSLISARSFAACGHVPHQCHPQQLNPQVLKFLKDLS